MTGNTILSSNYPVAGIYVLGANGAQSDVISDALSLPIVIGSNASVASANGLRIGSGTLGKGAHILTAASNSDTAGRCTLTGGTCTVTFTTSWGSTPVCVATD